MHDSQWQDRLRALVPLLRRSAGEVECLLTGASMGAAIPDGASIRIRCAERQDYSPGDIVAVQGNGRLIVHRVVHRGSRGPARRYFLTRGDERWLPDPPVHRDAVLGVVTAVSVNGPWSEPGAAPLPGPRPWLARAALLLYRSALEVHVGLALGLSRGLARLRAGYLRLFRG